MNKTMTYLLIFELETFLNNLGKDFPDITVSKMLSLKRIIETKLNDFEHDSLYDELIKYTGINPYNMKRYHITKIFIEQQEKIYEENNPKNVLDFLSNLCKNKSYNDFEHLLRHLRQEETVYFIDRISTMFKNEIEDLYDTELRNILRIKKIERILEDESN